MKIKDKAKPKTPPVPPGTYAAVCVGIIDLGEQYAEKFKKYSNQVQIIWELSGQTVEVDGEQKPRQLSRTFTMSTGKKSNLRAVLSSWNGVQYSDEQFGDLELFDQIGRSCMLSVVLNETGEYSNISAVIPLPTGYPAVQTATPPIRWDMDQWDDAVFETLPEWAKERIKQSTQYQKEHPPTGTIDFAAEAMQALNGGMAPAGNTAAQILPAPAPDAVPAAVPAGGAVMPTATAQGADTANRGPLSAPAAPGAVNPQVFAFPGPAVPSAQPQAVNYGGDVPF